MTALIGAGLYAAGAGPTLWEPVESKTLYDGSAAASHTFARAMARASGANRLWIIEITYEGAPSPTTSTLTYNGVSCGELISSTDDEATDNRVELWGIRGTSLPSDTSNHDVVITPSTSTAVLCKIDEYDGCGSLTPTWTDIDDTDPTPAALAGTSLEGDALFYGIGTNWVSGSVNFTFANGTETVDTNNSNFTIGGSYQLNLAAGTQSEQATVVNTGGRAASAACSLPRAA